MVKEIVKTDFVQLVVWPGVLMPAAKKGGDSIKEFEDFIKDELGTQIRYCETVLTLPSPGEPNTGGRSDIFFYVHNDDLGKFAVPRFRYGMRWWEDVLSNGGGPLYPKEILKKYPKTW